MCEHDLDESQNIQFFQKVSGAIWVDFQREGKSFRKILRDINRFNNNSQFVPIDLRWKLCW